MAIAIATSARIDFATLFTTSKANLTVALTCKVASLPTAAVRVVTCWGSDGTFEQAFAMSAGVAGSGDTRLYMGIRQSASAQNIQQTGTGVLSVGGLVRIVSRFASGTVAQFWVNGAQVSTTTLSSSGIPTSAGASNRPVQVGAESDESINALAGDYAEVAVWYEAVPDWVAIGYGKGMSPRYYRQNGALYCPMYATAYLVNEWDATGGTNTSGTTAAHPAMYYPG